MKNKKILVIAAHPDDEVLGCGGTLLKHATNNDKILLLFVTFYPTNSIFIEKNKHLKLLGLLMHKHQYF